MKALRYFLLCLVLPLFFAPRAVAQTTDMEGCKDSPLIPRYPGAIIVDCKDSADDTHTYDNLGPKQESKTVEGELHYVQYNFPDGATAAQVLRNVKTALKNAGYTFLYDDGSAGDFTVHMGNTWIGEEVSAGGSYRQTILIEMPEAQVMVANAAALGSDLTMMGHVVVNGILFDTGKSEVKPESAPALQQVAALLKQDPGLKLYVVGHTDNVGTFAANMDLSRARAAAVMQALVTQYGVAASRLQAVGDGPTAPVSTNDTDDGRALNRRVELVKQ